MQAQGARANHQCHKEKEGCSQDEDVHSTARAGQQKLRELREEAREESDLYHTCPSNLQKTNKQKKWMKRPAELTTNH